MARPVLLFSHQWVSLPLEELAARASDWGYAGFELACHGDHFDVQAALTDPDYCTEKLQLLTRYDLQVPVLSNHRVSQAVCDVIDSRHRPMLPEAVWGDGDPDDIKLRAADEMMATFRAAQRLGVGVVSGFTGSSIWSYVIGYPSANSQVIADGLQDFSERWNPILDAAADAGVRYAFEVHPGQIAYDYYSAEMALDAVERREEFGFLFDPSHLHYLGVDPVQFIRRFGDRIYHVHIKDVALTLDGRSSILNSYLPSGDRRRGWHFRAPGRGGVDWEGVIRELNAVGYAGPLSVELSDAGMDREFAAEEACGFVKRLDFDAPPIERDAFH